MLNILSAVFMQDVLLAFRQQADVAAALFFFVVSVSLFPLGVGADPQLLKAIAPGVLWVAALLSAMLSLGRMFSDGYLDGTLEQLMLSPVPLTLLVAVKMLAHWLISCLPLVIIAPLLGMQFNLLGNELAILAMSLLMGTPLLSLIGGIGAALTLGVRSANVLVTILVLPLYIPVLIFGAGAVTAATIGMSAQGALSLLGAFTVIGMVFAPFAAAQALRIALE